MMNLRHFVALLFCTIFGLSALQAQREQTILGDRGLRLSGAWGGTQGVISDFGNSNSFLSGGFGGLEFGKTLFIGYGTYELLRDVQWDNIQNKDFDFRYQGLQLGYAYRSFNPVHPTASLMLGRGKVGFANENKDRVMVIQPGLGVEFNILRWFHLGLEGGYRFVADTNEDLGLSDKDLSGAYGQVSLKFGFSWGKQTGWKKSTQSSPFDAPKM